MSAGFLNVYGGVFGMFFAAKILPFLLGVFDEKSILLIGFSFLAIFGAALAQIQSFQGIFMIWALFVAGFASCQSICDSWLTKMVKQRDVSVVFSMASCLEAVTRILAPIFGEILLTNFGVNGLALNFIFFSLSAFLFVRFLK